jgi:hypothetical protein
MTKWEYEEQGVRFRVEPVECSQNPREFSTVSAMYTIKTRRHEFGGGSKDKVFSSMRGLERELDKADIVLKMPLYRYEHSCVRLVTQNVSSWDTSGCIGYLVVHESDAEGLTEQQVEDAVEQELLEYNNWVNGEVYRGVLRTRDYNPGSPYEEEPVSELGDVLYHYSRKEAVESARFIIDCMMNSKEESCMTIDRLLESFVKDKTGYSLEEVGREHIEFCSLDSPQYKPFLARLALTDEGEWWKLREGVRGDDNNAEIVQRFLCRFASSRELEEYLEASRFVVGKRNGYFIALHPDW